MQVTVDVSDELRREAQARGIPIAAYVEMLMERGRQSVQGETQVSGALERIRALRGPEMGPRR